MEQNFLFLYPMTVTQTVCKHTCVFLPADVPAWLKSLRLHKYAGLFSTMTYEEMMSLTEHQLETQVSDVGVCLCVYGWY